MGYDSRVLTKLRNLQQERKKNLIDYSERFQDLLDRIPKTGEDVPYSTQQVIDWYVTSLPREIKTYCRRSKCDTIDDVIISAEAFETSTLNRRRKDRSLDEQKSKSSRWKRIVVIPSSTESSSSSESSEPEDFSSSEHEKPR